MIVWLTMQLFRFLATISGNMPKDLKVEELTDEEAREFDAKIQRNQV